MKGSFMSAASDLKKQIISNVDDGIDELEDILDWLIDYLSNSQIDETIEMLQDMDR